MSAAGSKESNNELLSASQDGGANNKTSSTSNNSKVSTSSAPRAPQPPPSTREGDTKTLKDNKKSNTSKAPSATPLPDNNNETSTPKRKIGTSNNDQTPDEVKKKKNKAPTDCDDLHKKLSNLLSQDCTNYFTESYFQKNETWPHNCALCNVRFGSSGFKVSSMQGRRVFACPKAVAPSSDCTFAYCEPCYNAEVAKCPMSPVGRTRGNRRHYRN